MCGSLRGARAIWRVAVRFLELSRAASSAGRSAQVQPYRRERRGRSVTDATSDRRLGSDRPERSRRRFARRVPRLPRPYRLRHRRRYGRRLRGGRPTACTPAPPPPPPSGNLRRRETLTGTRRRTDRIGEALDLDERDDRRDSRAGRGAPRTRFAGVWAASASTSPRTVRVPFGG